MEKKVPQHLYHIFFWAVMAILFFISFRIVQPFFISLISAFVLAFLMQPLYLLLLRKTNKFIAAVLALAMPLLVLIIPLVYLTSTLAKEILSAINSDSMDQLILFLQSWKPLTYLNLDIQELQNQIVFIIAPVIKEIIIGLPSFVIGTIITLVGAYYILINWSSLSSALRYYLPFKEKERVAKEIADATDSIVRGYLLIAAIEFIVALIGFKIAGTNYFILFSFFIAIFAFIPLLGPGLVWIPLALYNFAIGDIYAGVIITTTGLIISIIIDGLLVAKIIGDKAKINPLVMLIGILGGVPIFGIFGVIIGPLILFYTLKLIIESIETVKN
ncbi:AI-2E family transporter [Candidatus Pacearchaeota archaeon]|nr:AI-2E family transporter [Candidatus Pacearchaeota archaeon]